MAFIVQGDTRVPGANAYVKISYVTTYHDDRGNTAWASASTTERRIALIQSTDYLEQAYSQRFIGDNPTASGIHFPADNAYDRNGFLHEGVPDQVKKATSELALLALDTDIFDNSSVEQEVTSLTHSVGPVSTSTSYSSVQSNVPIYPRVDRILQPVLQRRRSIRQ